MINEGAVYTRGTSFRATAEAAARKYRASVLMLDAFDKYGHRLTDRDGKAGMNFLSSWREQIVSAVRDRAERGKGIDLKRTTKNMLSSQAMCFNLFVPLNQYKVFAACCLDKLIGDVAIVQEIEIEYTPSDEVFGDQTGLSGVDCDVLVRYQKRDGSNALLVIETKYVETEFSNCGFRNSMQKRKCPADTVVSDFKNCPYHDRKDYRYWEVTQESGIFDMAAIQSQPCPFGGSLWQLWTNQALAYALSKQSGLQDFKYMILYSKDNVELTERGAVFEKFSSLLTSKERFQPVPLESLMECMSELAAGTPNQGWVEEFVGRYSLCG